MKVKKINKFATELPKKSAFMIDTEPDFIKLHTLCIASGKRGGGKSVAIANLVKKAKDAGYFDKVYLITPTYNSNKQIWAIADIQEEDVYEPDMNVLKTIIANVEAEKAEWDAFLSRKKLLKQFKKDMKTTPYDKIGSNSMLDYLENGFFDVGGINEEWKYKNEVPPRLAVIVDDSLGTDLMARRNAGLTNLCIRHRHIADGLGISIFMLVQSYCAQGGVARAIRENCTHLLLFRINDENQIKKVKEESDLPITDEEWIAMCKYAHDIPYNFLMLDFVPKTECRRYRSGFDNYIITDSNACKCKGTDKMNNNKNLEEIKVLENTDENNKI
jgi:hypothetical protein